MDMSNRSIEMQTEVAKRGDAAHPDGAARTKISARKVNVFYGEKQALFDVDLDIGERMVTALIGPSGCGKSTFLRCLNRMNDTIDIARVTGKIELDGDDIYDPSIDVVELRARVGMVFQKPNPFPKSIFENVAYGPRIHGLARGKTELQEIVTSSLQRAGLFEEVKDRLDEPGTGLSGGQQQRLCIARAIAVSPEVILMDEPCSALDPIATARIEELIDELRQNYTIVIVTHSMQQAARVSQRTAMFHLGYLVEEGPTDRCSPIRASGRRRTTSPAASAEGDSDAASAAHRHLLRGRASGPRPLHRRDGRPRRAARRALHPALLRSDPDLAHEVIEADKKVDELHRQIEETRHPRHRPPPADGAGSARDDRRDPHRQRPRAHRRPRQEHRPRARSPSRAQSFSQKRSRRRRASGRARRCGR